MKRPRGKKRLAGAWGDTKKWQSTLTGGLKFSMIRSTMSEGDQVLGAERFNIATKARELDRAIDNLHDNTMAACKKLRTEANKESLEVFQKVLFVMRWANPRMAIEHQQYVIDYVRHLLSVKPTAHCPARFLCEAMWGPKSLGTESEKVMRAIKRLLLVIKKRTVLAYLQAEKNKSSLVPTRAQMVIKKESTLRWMIEKNPGRKDRFWTSWYYAQRGMPDHLERYLLWAKKRTIEAFEQMYGPMDEGNASKPTDRTTKANLDETARTGQPRRSGTGTGTGTGTGGSSNTAAALDTHIDSATADQDPGQQDWRALLAKHEAWKLAQDNDVNERDPDHGLSPLHYAAKRGDMACVRVLIKHGAQVNARAPDGRTPLHYAAAYSNRDICLELLSYWADVNAVDNYGCTPAVLAEQARNRGTHTVCTSWVGLLDIDTGGSTASGPDGLGEGEGDDDHTLTGTGGFGARRRVPATIALAHAEEDEEAALLADLAAVSTSQAEGTGDDNYPPSEWYKRPVSPIPTETIAAMDVETRIFAQRFEHAPGSSSATFMSVYGQGPSDTAVPDDVDNDDSLTAEQKKQKKDQACRGATLLKRATGIALDANFDLFLDMRVCAKFVSRCQKSTPPLVPEAIKGLRRWFMLGVDLALSLIEAELEEAAAAASASVRGGSLDGVLHEECTDSDDESEKAPPAPSFKKKQPARPFSCAACVEIGQKLVEALIAENHEGLAVYYLDVCLTLLGPHLLASTRAALLARKAEVLLCMWDVILYRDDSSMPVATMQSQLPAHHHQAQSQPQASLSLSPSQTLMHSSQSSTETRIIRGFKSPPSSPLDLRSQFGASVAGSTALSPLLGGASTADPLQAAKLALKARQRDSARRLSYPSP